MSPVVRLIVRSALAGVYTTAGALVASATGSSLDGNEILLAVLSGVIALVAAASLELGTSLNPTVGIGKGADPS